MNGMPASIRPALRRLERRLAIGLFLDVWPTWAVAGLLLAGLVAVVCRMFLPAAAASVHWLWLAPFLTAAPALVYCVMRAYRPGEVVAIADWLSGGQGMLLTLLETNDPAWAESPLAGGASKFPLPRLRPWRKLAALPPAVAFLATALWLPQRMPRGTNAILADDIAANLVATVAELKQQELITPDEEKKLDEEIERIRRGAEERVDASSWEAADALRDRVVTGVSEKQNALNWARGEPGSLRRRGRGRHGRRRSFSGARRGTDEGARTAWRRAACWPARPADVQRLLQSGRLPTDPQSLRELMASLSKHLADTKGRFGALAGLGKEFGRFDPSEFPLDSSQSSPDGDGDAGKRRLSIAAVPTRR